MRLVLASTSPFRKQQLEQLKLVFTTCPPGVIETPRPDETPSGLALRLSEEKARARATQALGDLWIGGDQTGAVNHILLHKPQNLEHAIEQLYQTSGQTVHLYSGLALFDARDNTLKSTVVESIITMRSFTKDDLKRYFEKEPEALQCMGGLKYEGLGVALTAKVEAVDPSAITGLPLVTLVAMLKAAHYPVL